jgi:hypothetical protein
MLALKSARINMDMWFCETCTMRGEGQGGGGRGGRGRSTDSQRGSQTAALYVPPYLLHPASHSLAPGGFEQHYLGVHVDVQPELVCHDACILAALGEAQLGEGEGDALQTLVVLEQQVVELLLHGFYRLETVGGLDGHLQQDVHLLEALAIALAEVRYTAAVHRSAGGQIRCRERERENEGRWLHQARRSSTTAAGCALSLSLSRGDHLIQRVDWIRHEPLLCFPERKQFF